MVVVIPAARRVWRSKEEFASAYEFLLPSIVLAEGLPDGTWGTLRLFSERRLLDTGPRPSAGKTFQNLPDLFRTPVGCLGEVSESGLLYV
jgi:hypothetical protein